MNQCVYVAFKGRLLLTNLNALNGGLWTTLYVESQTTAQPTTQFSFGDILCSLYRGPRYCASPCGIKF